MGAKHSEGRYGKMAETDLISRQAAIDAFDGAKVDEGWCTEYDIGYNDGIDFAVSKLSVLPSAQSERMTNRQWIDFLSAQFDISRTSAKEMLHGMMQWKKEDNFKKLFNGDRMCLV